MISRSVVLLLGLVGLTAVLLAVLLTVNPLFFKATPGSSYAGLETTRRSTSSAYVVFKPIIDPYDQLVDYFRPSNLRGVGCGLLPARPDRLPFNMLFGLARGCY